MCRMCLPPNARDLLLMVAVYTIVAIFLITGTGCSEQPMLRPGPIVVVAPPHEATDELDRLIERSIERVRNIDNSIARLNAINERADQMLLETRHQEVQRGAR